MENMERTASVYERLFEAATKPFIDGNRSSEEKIKYIKEAMYTEIVDDILFQLSKQLEKHCNGCHINHPSQRQHSCLTTTQEDLIDFYFEDILDQVDFYKVLEQWYPLLNRMHLSQWETERVHIMWTNIKEEFTMMARYPEPFWVLEWQERLRKSIPE